MNQVVSKTLLSRAILIFGDSEYYVNTDIVWLQVKKNRFNPYLLLVLITIFWAVTYFVNITYHYAVHLTKT